MLAQPVDVKWRYAAADEVMRGPLCAGAAARLIGP